MNRIRVTLAALALGAIASPAAAQTSMGMEGASFVQAVRDNDDSKAVELLRSHPNVVDYRDSKGETALIVAIGQRDAQWTGYLLSQKADPTIAANNGDTPLIAAARVGFNDAVEWLLQFGAKVDDRNKMGETALIVAVQRRQVPIVKLLLAKGADPDRTDTAAGYSARDYAKRDGRNPEILKLIESAKTKPVIGPVAPR